MARAWKEKYRTVAIPMENYEMLSELADEEGRSLTRQISWLISIREKNFLTTNCNYAE